MRMEHKCGRIGTQTVDEIVWRVATKLIELGRPWALTLDPEGLVMLERPKHAHPDDLLGVFDAEGGLLPTSRRVMDELREAIKARPPRPRQRRVLAPQRPKRAA